MVKLRVVFVYFITGGHGKLKIATEVSFRCFSRADEQCCSATVLLFSLFKNIFFKNYFILFYFIFNYFNTIIIKIYFKK